MKMKSFILKYASKIMFYDVNIACYQKSNAGSMECRKCRTPEVRNAGRTLEVRNAGRMPEERQKNVAQRVREDGEEKSEKREGCIEKRLEFGSSGKLGLRSYFI